MDLACFRNPAHPECDPRPVAQEEYNKTKAAILARMWGNYLTELALSMAIKGFEVFNDELNERQAVVAQIEGDDQRVARFCKTATWQFATMGTGRYEKDERRHKK